MSTGDDRYEFNAPQFVDFTQPQPLNDGADVFFDAIDGDVPIPDIFESSTEQVSDQSTQPSLSDGKSPTCNNNPQTGHDPEDSIPMEKKPSIGKPRRSVVRSSVDQARSKVEKTSSSSGRSTPQAKRAKLSCNTSIDSHNSSIVSAASSAGSPGGAGRPTRKVPKMTLATTPSFMRRSKKAVVALTTEEIEMDRIKSYRKMLAQRKKQSQQSYQMVQACPAFAPMKATHVTKTEEFQFSTDQRIKKQAATDPVQESEKAFTAGLRQYDKEKPALKSTGVTVPKPFNLSSGVRKRTHSASDSDSIPGNNFKYESDAEKVANFHTKTPERFRSRPANKVATPKRRGRSSSPKVTIPKAPNFETRGRKRPNTAISQNEREKYELEEMKCNQFKAQPLNVKILSNANNGVKKAMPRDVTEPKAFDFETDRRIQQHKDTHRAEEESEQKRAEIELQAMKSRTAFLQGIPFQPKLDHKKTQPEPFKVTERSTEMLLKRAEKIQKVLEEEKKAHEFYANPLPNLPPTLPAREVKEPTKAEPFNLDADRRGEDRAAEWKHKMEDELRQQRELAIFKAQPNNVIRSKPFVPQKSRKPMTDVNKFELHTDRRSEQRQVFEEHKKQLQIEYDLKQQERDLEKQEAEREEVARLRQEMVHKPNPIKNYKSVDIKPSEKPLTEAATPQLQTRLRSKVRV